jgi:hypothetical protein
MNQKNNMTNIHNKIARQNETRTAIDEVVADIEGK